MSDLHIRCPHCQVRAYVPAACCMIVLADPQHIEWTCPSCWQRATLDISDRTLQMLTASGVPIDLVDRFTVWLADVQPSDFDGAA